MGILKDCFVIIAGAAAVVGGATFLIHPRTDAEGTKQTLEQSYGFSEVQTRDGSLFKCQGWHKTDFTAINGDGKKVEGTVCRTGKRSQIFIKP